MLHHSFVLYCNQSCLSYAQTPQEVMARLMARYCPECFMFHNQVCMACLAFSNLAQSRGNLKVTVASVLEVMQRGCDTLCNCLADRLQTAKLSEGAVVPILQALCLVYSCQYLHLYFSARQHFINIVYIVCSFLRSPYQQAATQQLCIGKV